MSADSSETVAAAVDSEVAASGAPARGLAALEPSAEAGAAGEPGATPAAGEAPELCDAEVERELAALLFASPDALSTGKLCALLGNTPQARVEAGLSALSERLRAALLPWELRAIAGGWQLYTTPEMADTVARLDKARKDEKVSPAGLETLAIVAYRQPVTKGEIEAIRGVQVGPILRTLVDRGLAKVTGRSDEPGHALLYGTTKKFLDAFGLATLDDLPRDGELLRD